MAELSLESVQSSFAECGGNVLKIRKYIRDNQASLQRFSTNQLNKAVKEHLPLGMLLKRNYGHLALRSVGKTAAPKEEAEEPAPKKDTKFKKKQVEEPEYEYEYEEDVPEQKPTSYGRPSQQEYYDSPQVNPYMLSNADIARECFLPAAMRYRNRTW